MTYWRLFCHLVWGTKGREALIDDERADVIERSIRAACHELGVLVHAIGGMPDHLHVPVSIPPRLSIAEVVQRMKGESSHLLNHSAGREGLGWFAWQAEYGAVSFGERSLPQIVAYVANQSAHHSANNLWRPLELTDRPGYAGGARQTASS